MALTKVTGQVIKNTTDVTVGVLTVTNTLAVGGTVSIGGTLTYEDVTNVDAVGLVTARNGIVVGSGITLSKDGDVFFTGIATGNGSGLTALNASNLASGTVPTARLGSGTASSSTFLRGDSTFQTVNTDLVSDTSPQLGGDLDTNGNNISFDDNDQLRLGNATGGDIVIKHTTSDNNGHIENHTGDLLISTKGAGDDVIIEAVDDVQIKVQGGETAIDCIGNGAVKLYHDNELQAETAGNGLRIKTAGDTDTELSVVGPEGRNGIINLEADDGDDNADIWGLVAGTDGKFLLRNYTAGSYENNLRATGNGSVELFYDNENRVETDSNGAIIQTNGDAYLTILADADNNNSNNWPLIDFRVNNMSGTTEARIAYREDNQVLKFDIAGSEKVGVNGDGLVFNGDTAAANALDDYEEGSFTPTMKSSDNNPTFSYNHQRGKYVKIGRHVTVWIFVYATIGGTETGNLHIEGLPFTVRDEYAQILITDSGNWSSYPSNHSGWGGYAQLNDNHVVMLSCGDKSAGTVHASNWGNSTYIYATMSYMTDS